MAQGTPSAAATPGTAPTVVLVHGAFAAASGWSGIITRLQAAGISDVVVSPNACIAQHAYGCVVMIYPDGIWYRIREMAEAEKVLEQHIIGGKPVKELIHRTVNPPTGKGVQPPPARQPVAS